MTLDEKIKLVREKTHAILKKAQQYYDLDFWPSDVEILFDLRGQSAGQVTWWEGFEHRPLSNVKIRYNVQAIEKGFDHVYNETIPHEIAHLVAWDEKSHGTEWSAACRNLGGTGKRCHSINLEKARNVRQWLYRLDSGREVILKTGRHNKLQKGMCSYRHGVTSEQIEYWHFVKEV